MPLFPFGHGLSYASFEYSKLVLDKKQMKDTDQLRITIDVTNTGTCAAQEIVQLYVRDIESQVIRPDKELKGFDKVALAPGETKTVTFDLGHRSFAYYDVELKGWVVESGEFEILIGKSSRDIVLRDGVEVISTTERQESFHRNSTISDLMKTEKGAAFVKEYISMLPFASAIEGSHSEMLKAFMQFMPLRGLISFSGGKFREADLQGVLEKLNGR